MGLATEHTGLADLARAVAAFDHTHAACRGMNPDLFYPERGQSTREPKQVCAQCPVREDCLEFALTTGGKFGIWGGKSERERRALRRQRKAVSVGDAA